MGQMLLFPDPKPLVERLGRQFFYGLPECPGVYLMRDAQENILYVGKAKNLKRRLNSYRVANPDRLSRRYLRLLRAVARIELQECPDETAALAREAELLLALKPKFNRAGTWPATPRFLVWQRDGTRLALAISETPAMGWQAFGPFGGGAIHLRAALARLLWYALNPAAGSSTMPAGWMHGRLGAVAEVTVVGTAERGSSEVEPILAKLFAGEAEGFVAWVGEQTKPLVQALDLAMRDADLETVSGFIEAKVRRPLPFPAPDARARAGDRRADALLPFGDENWKQP
jgi:predicted GIY-YIG superfamily endonuclease